MEQHRRLGRVRLMRAVTAAVVLGLCVTAMVLSIPRDPQAVAKVERQVVVETPEGCSRFIRVADLFVGTTSELLDAQNNGLDALIIGDPAGIDATVEALEVIEVRFAKVSERYTRTRDSCLVLAEG